MRRLPVHVQAILNAQAELSLDSLANVADNILDLSPGITTAPSPVFATPDTQSRYQTQSHSHYTTNYILHAANGSVIKIYGSLPLCLSLELRHEFRWNFII